MTVNGIEAEFYTFLESMSFATEDDSPACYQTQQEPESYHNIRQRGFKSADSRKRAVYQVF